MLEVQDIHVYYGNIHALKGVSLSVGPGEIVTLIGANGAGKSTTLMTISGIRRPRRGTITLDGKRIDTESPEAIVRLGVVQVPEGRRIFPHLTVRENLRIGAFARDDRDDYEADLRRVMELFPRLKERENQLGGTLSGGEQQMLAIGRALMARPRVLLLDEPSLGLAPIIVDQIFEIIREINQSGTAVLLVEQNALAALKLSHRGYVIETGSVRLSGPSDELLTNPEVRRAYLG